MIDSHDGSTEICNLAVSAPRVAPFSNGDYTPINAAVWQQTNRFEADKTNSDLLVNREDFFNGNISAMVTTITNPTTGEILPQGMAYSYDQLNRLLSAKAFVNLDMQANTWQSGSTYANRYYNAFTYDANGNILTQQRHDQSGTMIEDMTYNYERSQNTNKMLRNRLYHVNDNVAANAFADDIDDQGVFNSNNSTMNTANNYGYDGEGRLVRDDAEEIAQITWTVTGKVKEVNRTSGSQKKNLKFRYDAMGQRIAKEVYSSNNVWEKTTFYVRDPQGNVMGIYERTMNAQQLISYKIVERNIYGSSMVGLVKSDVELIGAGNPSCSSFVHVVAKKQLYTQNHLSNVISVVSDMKIAHDWNGDLIVDYYRADIVSVSDVFPYGSPMQSRTMNSTAVRHSFNSQEKDNEIYGDGNMTTAEYWQYDSRLGRRWNLDPKPFEALSSYACLGNNPIIYLDFIGDSAWTVKNKWDAEYEAKYREYAAQRAGEITEDYTCEDFALVSLMEFARDNQLPFEWVTESESFDATGDAYDSYEDFSNAVMTRTGANDFLNNENTSGVGPLVANTQPGDVIVLDQNDDKKGDHVQVVTSVAKGPDNTIKTIDIRQGQSHEGSLSGDIFGNPNDPTSWAYVGAPAENGTWNYPAGTYVNLDKNETIANATQVLNPAYRKFNFQSWNK